VIRTFADKDTEKLFHRERVRRFQNVELGARKALLALHAATSLNDLAAMRGLRLEKMPEIGPEFWSIRANEQYRVIFTWDSGNADQVKLADHYKP
jgi:proteic killer suppression protein